MPFSSKRDSERERTIMENRYNSITLSTGNVNKKYVLRDIIFATDRVEIDLFAEETNPNEVFQNVCKKLKQMAFEYEADAVINCHFEEKFIVKDSKKYVEIFAYGTVVQFTQTTIG
ncbi:heavy metal-binding domain-containing protein [Enterococcus larvae]